MIYSGVTGEGNILIQELLYFRKGTNRTKRLAIMDQDGSNLILTDSKSIVLAPDFPDSKKILYTSYETGKPRVYLWIWWMVIYVLFLSYRYDFCSRFSPDGKKIILSITENGNTDIYTLNLENN